MGTTTRERVRDKILRQLNEDGGDIGRSAENDDPRVLAVVADLEALDSAADDDPVIEELAARYWVP